jgi:flavorubredoxin
VRGPESSRLAEVAPGVFALSSLVDLARHQVSWVPPGTEGYDPATCYVVQSDGESQLIDTGLRAHHGAVLSQLRRLAPLPRPVHVAFTRVEPDCLGNLDQVADTVHLVRLSSQTNVIPLDYLGPLSGGYPEVRIENGLHPGDRITFGAGRTLLVVEPAVRTLPTLWYFDADSGALFTSDFFTDLHVVGATWDGPAGDVETVRRHLLAKFDWLAAADTTRAVARLDAVFDQLPVTAIAPAHGRWTVGRDAVLRRYRLAREALCGLGTSR